MGIAQKNNVEVYWHNDLSPIHESWQLNYNKTVSVCSNNVRWHMTRQRKLRASFDTILKAKHVLILTSIVQEILVVV